MSHSLVPQALSSDRLRLLAVLALTIYATMVSVSPALHHDLACHVKSPTHCDACQANPLASRDKAPMRVGAPQRQAIGEPLRHEEHHPDHAAVESTSGRSPPA